MREDKYFWCYSSHMAYFLIEVKGIKYITEALRPKDKKKFYLFERSTILQEGLDEYMTEVKEKLSYEELEKLSKNKN